MNDSTRVMRRSRRAGPPPARTAAAIVATAAPALLPAACGGSPSSEGSPPSTGSGSASSAFVSHELTFARCVRVHGVPNFPDPAFSGGVIHSSTRSSIDTRSSEWFTQARQTCARLIPGRTSQQRVGRLKTMWAGWLKRKAGSRAGGGS